MVVGGEEGGESEREAKVEVGGEEEEEEGGERGEGEEERGGEIPGGWVGVLVDFVVLVVGLVVDGVGVVVVVGVSVVLGKIIVVPSPAPFSSSSSPSPLLQFIFCRGSSILHCFFLSSSIFRMGSFSSPSSLSLLPICWCWGCWCC